MVWDGLSANLPRSTLGHRCWEWQRGSAGVGGYKYPVDPGLGYQETVGFVPPWKSPAAVFLCCDCPPSLTRSDLRRGSTFPCPRSMPVASCSNSIWAQLPTASPRQIFWPSERRQTDTRAPIFLSLSEMLSCSLYERSSLQPTSNGYIFYNRFYFIVPGCLVVINLRYILIWLRCGAHQEQIPTLSLMTSWHRAHLGTPTPLKWHGWMCPERNCWSL